jgi:hypothetical protein
VYSYLLANTAQKQTTEATQAPQAIRVISDTFSLPGGLIGRYGCSSAGLVLLTQNKHNIDKIQSGSAIYIDSNSPAWTKGGQDKKSGALIMDISKNSF